ncbi:Type II restriction enzyme, methylase subunit YeeA [Enhygromyxa salina]|uniref:site-specific DNA-methyltransferase (adenine-specific) n=1 Tax=Enhygromyxa salina TaxID=215803 RepID=A0A0C2CX70_9BACT|nr:DNA methyltransferase [Enhygromyxa salina]KIG12452.1 Type II restriction enzyme, methylase subunit YeeA [Enhygromyxa salina]
MDPEQRRQLGAHYTSEADVLTLLRALFLEDLDDSLARVLQLHGPARELGLAAFHDRLAALRLLDPACGCGDFLLVAYRELRRLELELLRHLPAPRACKVSIQQLYGIELQPAPAKLARASLSQLEQRLDHELADALGCPLPRRSAPARVQVRCANALRVDWASLLPADACAYVIGNPPFVGKKARSAEQVADMQIVFANAKGTAALDYACAWFVKAADYVAGTTAEVAYVATNSITQGEHPGLLWPLLRRDRGIEITFAHRSFAWRGQANVHVVIIGFAARAQRPRRIYEAGDVRVVDSINPYLVEGPHQTLSKRRDPLDPSTPRASFGNMPNDGGHLLLDEAARRELLRADPSAARFIRPYVSAKQFLAGQARYCLWLADATPGEFQQSERVRQRVANVRAHRQASTRAATRKLADTPGCFAEIRQPATAYVLIPRHPSARRAIVPLGYFTPDYIVADSCVAIPGASMYHFGVLSSAMHDAWLRQVGGRIKSDLRYSIELVYNNFPWPTAATPAQQRTIERCAARILQLRQRYASTALGGLYAPDAIPGELAAAHRQLDAAVDDAYGIDPRVSPGERVALLFTLRQRTDQMKFDYKIEMVPEDVCGGYNVPAYTEGALEVWQEDVLFLRAEGIPLVEFAIVLARWLHKLVETETLYYASMDFEEEPIFALSWDARLQGFMPSSVWSMSKGVPVPLEVARGSAASYIENLCRDLAPHGICLTKVIADAIDG